MGSLEQGFLYFVFTDKGANSCYHDILCGLANVIYLVLLGSSLSLSRLQQAVLTFLLMFQFFLQWLILKFHLLQHFLGELTCVCFLMFQYWFTWEAATVRVEKCSKILRAEGADWISCMNEGKPGNAKRHCIGQTTTRPQHQSATACLFWSSSFPVFQLYHWYILEPDQNHSSTSDTF